MTEPVPGYLRNTKQREEILALLRREEDFRSAQQLFTAMRLQGSKIGLATVYRNLQALVDAGEADTMRLPTGEQLYRLCGQAVQHHHHLICRYCARTIDIIGPAVEKWADRVAAEHEFTAVSHTLDIFGTCPSCSGGAD